MAVPYWQKFGLNTIVSQIGWDANSPSNLLTLLPAGHEPGMYEVSFVLVVRTGSGGTTSTAVATWASPTFGAESKTLSASLTLSSTGTTFSNGNTQTAMHRAVPIVSAGTAAITLQLNSSGAAGVIDIYATARLIATLP